MQQSDLDVIKEYGSSAFSPDFGAWADLQYEDENGQDMPVQPWSWLTPPG
ncbi:hypothetical protein N752_26040 [Desulforamulus aquiferis]|nr:hypothetical protein [Desulforamulus aquiferis]RYD02277.1 hypothetical protein N752_26040 [Desulforamulus aquiferis]